MNATDFYSDFENDPVYIELQEMLNIAGVTLGGGETLEELIEMYHPDILLDGGDWREHEGVGRRFAKAVRFFNRVGGYSSSEIIERCKRSN